jgi:phospho-N-acetylmuramoyl-pentapeptide-transferase
MLLWLIQELREYFTPLRVFRYVSFRIIAAMLTAMAISFVLHPWFIRRLQSRQIGQVVRKDGPESHFSKAGTPTMGGSLVLFALVIPTILWADLSNLYVWAALTITVGYGIIGFIDDYKKLKQRNSKGLAGRYKLLFQFALAGIVLTALFRDDAAFDRTLYVPFVKADWLSFELPFFAFIVFAMFVVAGTSNAVNLTDGLDGLAIGPVMVAAMTKTELLSVIICGLFVVEALSVIAQTTSFKLTGKRVFRMAPIHHHFEKLGWQEPKIVVRFWIISIMLALVALASIKVR